MSGHQIAFAAGFDFARPTRQQRSANATFVEVTFESLKRAVTVKEHRIMATFFMCSVVAGQHDDRVVIDI